MKIGQSRLMPDGKWHSPFPQIPDERVDLVLIFASNRQLMHKTYTDDLKKAYPGAQFFGCSTAGEIYSTLVEDDSLVVTAVSFEHTKVHGAQVKLSKSVDSYQAGRLLARSFEKEGLVHIFVLSDGIRVNGSELVKGLSDDLPNGVTVTGGLAGDGERFQETRVFWNSDPEKDTIAAIGFYGDRLQVGYGSLGGWDPFGPERMITASKGNVLYELDGYSALELYKKYLGEHARGLPATGLLFPLSLRTKETTTGLVRTILAINEDSQSMTFAGDMPEGTYARLMKANVDRLIDGAVGAAKLGYEAIGSHSPELAVLVSCVGRRMVLKQRTEEEVEGVRDILGNQTVIAGFYSYGEISPFVRGTRCELHNQTMTVTVYSEKR